MLVEFIQGNGVKRIDRGDSEQLVFRQPLGWGVWIALPFYLAVTAGGAFLFSMQDQRLEGGARVVFLGAIVVWLGLGISTAWLWFSRIGVAVDRRRGVVTRSTGLFVPIFPTEYPLPTIDAVAIDLQSRGSGRGKTYEHVVQVKHGMEMVTVARGSDYAPIRTVAEEIARFVNLPLADLGRGDGQLIDLNAQPAPRVRPTIDARTLPQLKNIACEQLGPELRLRYPLDGLGWFTAWLVLLAGAVSFLVFMWNESKGNWAVIGMFGGILGLVMLILFAAMKPERKSISIDPERLQITTRGLLLSSTAEVRWDDIKELVRSYKLISLLDSKAAYMFGSSHTTEAEAIAVYDLLHSYWRGSSPAS